MSTINKATNAHEAKIITDNYIATLTLEEAVKITKEGYGDESNPVFGFASAISNLTYQIGAGAYYYGNSNHFCSQIIEMAILDKIIENSKNNSK